MQRALSSQLSAAQLSTSSAAQPADSVDKCREVISTERVNREAATMTVNVSGDNVRGNDKDSAEGVRQGGERPKTENDSRHGEQGKSSHREATVSNANTFTNNDSTDTHATQDSSIVLDTTSTGATAHIHSSVEPDTHCERAAVSSPATSKQSAGNTIRRPIFQERSAQFHCTELI